MKHFSFKVLFFCVLLPPVYYVFTVQVVETYFKKQYEKEIEDIYLGDTRPLLNGIRRLKTAININIDYYLRGKELLNWGLELDVWVTTRNGTILYPASYEIEKRYESFQGAIDIASENYRLMDEGLVIKVEIRLDHNRLLSNSILLFYLLMSGYLLYFYYKKGVRKITHEDLKKVEEIDVLKRKSREYTQRLNGLKEGKQTLLKQLKELKKEYKKKISNAIKNEDEMIEEIISFEKDIEDNIQYQANQEEEIELLKEKVFSLEQEIAKNDKQKKRTGNILDKRFKALYGNVSISSRAVKSFLELTEEMRIKCEKIIHQLNADSNMVPVKRKVFRKKGGRTIFEVIFAYYGRLYFQKKRNNRIEVVTIGTKNTQQKDLEYLENLPKN